MRLILLGPPGCGKGTQAKTLCRDARAEHVGTGDLLRDAIRRETPAGIEARREVDAGHLVPDEVVNLLIGERFGRGDRPSRSPPFVNEVSRNAPILRVFPCCDGRVLPPPEALRYRQLGAVQSGPYLDPALWQATRITTLGTKRASTTSSAQRLRRRT